MWCVITNDEMKNAIEIRRSFLDQTRPQKDNSTDFFFFSQKRGRNVFYEKTKVFFLVSA